MFFSTSAAISAGDPSAATPSRSPSHEGEQFRFDAERLYMITEALWTLMKEKHGYDDNELIKQISLIDLRDGKLDGRAAAMPPEPCPKCNRTLGRTRQRCIYCGEIVASSPFEH